MSKASPSRGPKPRAGSTPAGRDRRPLLIAGGEPTVDRVHLAGRMTLSVLIASLCAAIALSLFAVADTPLGWGLTGAAALAGLAVPWAWYRFGGSEDTPLAISRLAPTWVELVTQAASHADRLGNLADRSPTGAVAEHLARLADTADSYVLAMYDAARRDGESTAGSSAAADPELRADMQQINAGLAELVEAAERLWAAQQRHLTPSPLAELSAETNRLAAALHDDLTQLGEPDAS
ncbi:MAG: hypothetical protein ACR2QO_18750 [Acidimicrobiales bacterium]